MAYKTIIEINHDKAHLWLKDPKFSYNLYHALAGTLNPIVKERILNNYGIKILSQHHSSRIFKLEEQP